MGCEDGQECRLTVLSLGHHTPVVVSTLEVILKDVINYLLLPSQLHFLPLSQKSVKTDVRQLL